MIPVCSNSVVLVNYNTLFGRPFDFLMMATVTHSVQGYMTIKELGYRTGKVKTH